MPSCAAVGRFRGQGQPHQQQADHHGPQDRDDPAPTASVLQVHVSSLPRILEASNWAKDWVWVFRAFRALRHVLLDLCSTCGPFLVHFPFDFLQQGRFRLRPFLFQGLPGPDPIPPGGGQLVLGFTIQPLTLGLQKIDVGLLGLHPGLALPQGLPDGPEQHHIEEKDQDQKSDQLCAYASNRSQSCLAATSYFIL